MDKKQKVQQKNWVDRNDERKKTQTGRLGNVGDEVWIRAVSASAHDFKRYLLPLFNAKSVMPSLSESYI